MTTNWLLISKSFPMQAGGVYWIGEFIATREFCEFMGIEGLEISQIEDEKKRTRLMESLARAESEGRLVEFNPSLWAELKAKRVRYNDPKLWPNIDTNSRHDGKMEDFVAAYPELQGSVLSCVIKGKSDYCHEFGGNGIGYLLEVSVSEYQIADWKNGLDEILPISYEPTGGIWTIFVRSELPFEVGSPLLVKLVKGGWGAPKLHGVDIKDVELAKSKAELANQKAWADFVQSVKTHNIVTSGYRHVGGGQIVYLFHEEWKGYPTFVPYELIINQDESISPQLVFRKGSCSSWGDIKGNVINIQTIRQAMQKYASGGWEIESTGRSPQSVAKIMGIE